MRILVIEDDTNLNRQVKDALTEGGYAVDVAFDGEEGHFLGDTEPYDAVVLDIGLPQMDGLSVLEEWRRAGKSMPVLLLTAKREQEDRIAGLELGADDYLAKPFSPRELVLRVRSILRRAGEPPVTAGARVLQAGPLPELDLADALRLPLEEAPLLVALDEVEDPQNVGAVARAAEGLGAKALLLTRRRAPPLSPAVSRASAGAIEHLPVVRVPNLTRALRELHERGYWRLGGDSDPEATPIEASADARFLAGWFKP